MTPLSWAAWNGHLEVVEFLVEEGGADVESKDLSQRTALDRARQEAAKGNWWNKERCKAVAAWLESRSTNHGSRAN